MPRSNSPDAAPEKFREAVRREGLRLGFSLVGFTTADPLGASAERRWRRWLGTEHAGVMDYLRRAHPRRTHPRDLLPEARSIIVVGTGYHDGDHEASATGTENQPSSDTTQRGKVARYAWGEDYHHLLRERLAQLAKWIVENVTESEGAGPVHWRAVVDSAPLDERALAERAGLGFIGKNTLLLHPTHGSWMLLGELLISIPFAPDEPAAGSCASCRKCVDACPTRAIDSPYQLDPRLCISYLTIEQREAIPRDLAEKMRGWAFGCDICQEVCPYNAAPLPRLFEGLGADRGIGPYVTSKDLCDIPSNKAFQRRWGKTPLERPGLKGMRRNLAAAADSVGKTKAREDEPEHENEHENESLRR